MKFYLYFNHVATLFFYKYLFQKLDLNGDGVVSMDEFLEACKADETIYQSVASFTNSIV